MKVADYINGIGHLGIVVPDIDNSVKFYTEKFGFVLIHKKIVIDPVDGTIEAAFVKKQDMLLELFTPMSIRNQIYSRKNGVLDHFAIDCGNVEGAYEMLSQKGLKLHESTKTGVVYYNDLGKKGVVGVNFCGSFGEVVEVCSTKDKEYNGVNVMQGWSHLAIKVRNLDVSKSFYEKLGFKLSDSGYVNTPQGTLDIIFMECKGFVLEIIQTGSDLDVSEKSQLPGFIDHFALDTNDVKEAFVLAGKEGFKVLNPVIKELNLFEKGIAYFMIEGPEGEIIEINQKKKW